MLDKNFEKLEKNKDYVKKNLEAIKIINDEIVDIINGQGCLIKLDDTVLFGSDSEGNKKKIKEFLKPYKVTSHGYLYCAEIIGEFENGDKFYIHAQEPYEFKRMLEAISQELKEEDKKVVEIEIKSDFSRYNEEDETIEDKKRRYKRYAKQFGVEDEEDIEIKDESFVGFTPEKVVGYDTIDDKNIN